MEKLNNETNKLTYLVAWGKNRETAWSGTYFSLYNALSKYFDVTDVDVTMNRYKKAFMSHVLRMDSRSIEAQNLYSTGRKMHNVKGNVFQFTDYLYNDEGRNTYMYVDHLMSHVNYMREHLPDVYAIAGFGDLPSSIVVKRATEQNDYVRSCSSLFTMGHWLSEWLISQGLPSDHIHPVGGVQT